MGRGDRNLRLRMATQLRSIRRFTTEILRESMDGPESGTEAVSTSEMDTLPRGTPRMPAAVERQMDRIPSSPAIALVEITRERSLFRVVSTVKVPEARAA